VTILKGVISWVFQLPPKHLIARETRRFQLSGSVFHDMNSCFSEIALCFRIFSSGGEKKVTIVAPKYQKKKTNKKTKKQKQIYIRVLRSETEMCFSADLYM